MLIDAESRISKKRRRTRASLLEAAYHVMSEGGIDAAKIKDITDRADVGFGTFYNYFDSKDQLASQVLDCLINDFGRRNVMATKGLRKRDPALVMPVSIRLVLREVITAPLWQWWALRPDLLVDRMRRGFGPFGLRDMRDAARLGIFKLKEEDLSLAWDLSVWMMVAGIHDVVVGQREPECVDYVTNSIMRVMGVEPEVAAQLCNTPLPEYSPPMIDWTFALDEGNEAAPPPPP